ncbi:glyoxalase [Lentzea sp. NBRC 105346]|uniref:VOC family protein n=1 Tax=Lentzea sp. NBRC 105346 TaxID=3032205 RepID=UPI0024A5C064|nr:VOC family protein [Lentzea sp. NBRC 105346]GLZ28576.1 glyoxalase [Lentzea sp. NBRC 105346]
MLRGFATVNYFADDVPAAVAWYTEVLGAEPYFKHEINGQPAYVEFRVGDYTHELGIADRRYVPAGERESGQIVYWHVDDVYASFERLLTLGAKAHMMPIKRGDGFVPASVIDPFGNILGIMYNQHYLDVLGEKR